MEYGEEWKNSRRIFQQYFSSKNMNQVEDKVLAFVRKFLLPSILEDPQKFDEHFRRQVGILKHIDSFINLPLAASVVYLYP